jgi:16S rRNA (uracil1498-N3)-methyltransferase
MRVHEPVRWADWCPRQVGRRLIAHPGGAARGFAPHEDVTVAVGPEGGFTDQEVGLSLSNGWERLTLGPRVLRVETAALAAAVLIGGSDRIGIMSHKGQ